MAKDATDEKKGRPRGESDLKKVQIGLPEAVLGRLEAHAKAKGIPFATWARSKLIEIDEAITKGAAKGAGS